MCDFNVYVFVVFDSFRRRVFVAFVFDDVMFGLDIYGLFDFDDENDVFVNVVFVKCLIVFVLFVDVGVLVFECVFDGDGGLMGMCVVLFVFMCMVVGVCDV